MSKLSHKMTGFLYKQSIILYAMSCRKQIMISICDLKTSGIHQKANLLNLWIHFLRKWQPHGFMVNCSFWYKFFSCKSDKWCLGTLVFPSFTSFYPPFFILFLLNWKCAEGDNWSFCLLTNKSFWSNSQQLYSYN